MIPDAKLSVAIPLRARLRLAITSQMAPMPISALFQSCSGGIMPSKVIQSSRKYLTRQRVVRVFRPVKLLWVETFPPCIFSVRLGQTTIVENVGKRTGCISTMCHLIPPPITGLMHALPHTQTAISRNFSSRADNIPIRAYALCVPLVMPGVPSVKTIMKIGQYHEKLCTGLNIKVHEFFRLPV